MPSAPSADARGNPDGPRGASGQTDRVDVWSAPTRDLRRAMTAERAALVALIEALPGAGWRAPTEAGHWRVGDVARHLLDDDLGLLSRWRDGDRSGLVPTTGDHTAFVAALDAKNERWVTATGGLSARVTAGLLAWSGAEVDAFLATVDLRSRRHVGWAGGDVPAWLDIAREHTERWVHGRHLADAVGADRGADPTEVLRTFVWAVPAQLGPAAPGATVGVRLGEEGWTASFAGDHWSLDEGWPGAATATLALDAETAWRQLTGVPVHPRDIRVTGDPRLVDRLLAVRSIIV